jgi:transcriptional regulator with XRE-family HTH domain
MAGPRRTRKWAYVEQEAKRLASLGLSAGEIAGQLNVNRSTVSRWMKSGKLTRGTVSRFQPVSTPSSAGQTPAEWVATVRSAYALDATDEQLVLLAESALAISRDPRAAPHVRMNAAGRFQALVRQLALVARKEDADKPDAPEANTAEPPTRRLPMRESRRPTVDPRTLLQAVK